MHRRLTAAIAATLSALGLIGAGNPAAPPVARRNFGDEVAFLKRHTPLVILSSPTGKAQLALAPAWQGRVMTSTADGPAGLSFGWINHDLIQSGKLQPHINAFGGEDRFWLGPEGGQFGFYFRRGDPFDLDHWQVPAELDSKPFTLVAAGRDHARFAASFSLTNASGTHFDMSVARDIRLLDARSSWQALGIAAAPGVRMVAYESRNRLTNSGAAVWTRETGLPSIWILGMFAPSPTALIVVPLKPAADGRPASGVTSNYFGEIPADRLTATPRALVFKADGAARGKIGVAPERSAGVLGSYDPAHHLLTIVQFDQPGDAADYVNSLWEQQAEPFRGTAANAYNDGPPSPGAKPLGPFYELESSSPAAALTPGASISHVHRTLHITGDMAALDTVARHVLGLSISDIETALPGGGK